MSLFYEKIICPLLFRQDPEWSHDQAVTVLKLLSKCSWLCRVMEAYNQPSGVEPCELFGLRFPNMVGLAAGFDKNAVCWQAAKALGFGFAEVGTVTYQRQPGNPRPRLHRLTEDQALINHMGFNNDGAEAVARRLARHFNPHKKSIPLGINIGKSKTVSLDAAAEDYLNSFHRLADYADYFTINVSSPNTPNLQKLQGVNYLTDLLTTLRDADNDRSKKMGVKLIPMLVKISPDLSFRQVDDVLEVVQSLGLAGIISCNTSLSLLPSSGDCTVKGALSGRPLLERSLDMINYIHRATSGKLPIIGVGGITDVTGAGRMADAGASLVQLYTGLVYRGPFFPKQVAQALAWRQKPWLD